jgi:dolichol-phosphate mannosyltransferase
MEAISLVIPAFNEAAVIARAVAEAETALTGRFAGFEVLVIDDGSLDDTAAVVEGLLPAYPHTRLLRHTQNRGYGAALRTGFEAARFPLVAFTDADCQFDLTELPGLAALARRFPIVAGFRLDRKDPWKRRFYSRGYNWLARNLLGTRVRDVDCALKVFRREALAVLLPESRGFFVNTEMMTRARQLGLTVVEVPVSHRPRAGGQSKVSALEIPGIAARLLRFWWSKVLFGPAPGALNPQVVQARVRVGTGERGPVPAPAPSSELAPRVELPARPREAA